MMRTHGNELLERLLHAGRQVAARDATLPEPAPGAVTRIAARWAASEQNEPLFSTASLAWRIGLGCAVANLLLIAALWLTMPAASGGDAFSLFLVLP